jgi:hypothetical protein
MKYNQLQKKVEEFASIKNTFSFEQKEYVIKLSGKPVSRNGGEPKTDLFILAENIKDKSTKEFKISFKKTNADFLENKITKITAESLFGEEWFNILTEPLKKITDKIKEKKIVTVSFNKHGNVKEKSITAGWRVDLTNKNSGKLVEKITLTKEQKRNLYAGTNLTEEKRNATINKEIVKDSGVVNYICIIDDAENLQEIFDNVIAIDEFLEQDKGEIFLACKASNIWFERDKRREGNRSLGIYLDWFVNISEKLDYNIVYNEPLEKRTDDVIAKLDTAIKKLNIENFIDLKNVLETSINFY